MRKLTRKGFTIIILSFLIILWIMVAIAGISAIREHKQSSESDQDGWILNSNVTNKGMIEDIEIEPGERIFVEFLSVNYLEDKEYLMRVEVGGEQVGIIYFDENGEIRFDGDKEKFEDAIFKAFDARRVK